MSGGSVSAIRGTLVAFCDDPFLVDPAQAFRYEADGLVICRKGLIEAVGPYGELRGSVPAGATRADYSGCIISPGFVDIHTHYVQSEMIAGPGRQLLGWLEDYVYPTEEGFADEAHGRRIASFFLDALLRNGTTTACVYCATFPQSADALFVEAGARGMRIAARQCLRDRNAPAPLLATAQAGYDASKALIGKWHNHGRLLYAITPRWAGGSTPAQLEVAGALWHEVPDLLLQTHIAESRAEIAFVADLFPERGDYLDVYEHYGLVGRRTLLGHAVWFTDSEFARCHERNASIAHCPTSNEFLGSGLFPLRKAKDSSRPIHVKIGTDISAGTSFSALVTLNETYKVAALNAAPITALEGFYLATWAAPAPSTWRTASVRCVPAERPILSCSIRKPRCFCHSASPVRARSRKHCSC